MTKYAPLGDFLANQLKSELRLGFDEVERILGASLPRSAYEHQAWWANNPEGHSHCRSWHDVGWRTEGLNLSGRSVVFARASDGRKTPYLCHQLFGHLTRGARWLARSPCTTRPRSPGLALISGMQRRECDTAASRHLRSHMAV